MAAPSPIFDPDPIDLILPQRQITLRNVKGSALTYAEMDKNFSSFFYSASLSSTNLLLHYTGSTVLGAPYTPSSIIVPLNPLLSTVQQLTVAGQAGDVQYKVGSATLGANSSFKWDAVNSRLGVGTPSPLSTLHVTNPNPILSTRLTISTQATTGLGKSAAVNFNIGTTTYHSVGITNANTTDLFITALTGQSNPNPSVFTTIGSTKVLQANSTGLGVLAVPNNALTVQGVIGVGSDTTANQGLIGSIGTKVLVASLPSNSTLTGLLVESPKNSVGSLSGGHVVIGLNQTATNTSYAFSVVAGSNGAYTTPLLTVKADGKVGLNKANPTQALDIVGNTTMTGPGNINIDGTATIVTVADSQGANSKVLTVNGSGLVQYANNLMPLGGIIMWSGAPNALPTGWALCDGTGSYGPVGNTSPIPDLRERFIVGAGIEPLKTVIDYSAPFTISSYQVVGANNTTFTIDTANPYYLDNTGVLRQGVNIDGYRYHLYKGPGSTSSTGFKYIVFDNRYSTYSLIVGALPAVGIGATGTTIFCGDFVTGVSFANGAQLDAAGRQYYHQGNDQHASYTKYFTKGRRVAYKEINWQTTTSPGYAVGDKGGEDNVTLLGSQIPKHQHDSSFGEKNSGGPYGNSRDINDSNGSAGGYDNDNRRFLTSAQGNNQPIENRPPYYALAFIIYTGV